MYDVVLLRFSKSCK